MTKFRSLNDPLVKIRIPITVETENNNTIRGIKTMNFFVLLRNKQSKNQVSPMPTPR